MGAVSVQINKNNDGYVYTAIEIIQGFAAFVKISAD